MMAYNYHANCLVEGYMPCWCLFIAVVTEFVYIEITIYKHYCLFLIKDR